MRVLPHYALHGSEFGIERLLQPIGVARFFSEYYEKKPLRIARGDPDYYQGLLSLDAVDRFLTSGNAAHPEVVLVKHEDEIPSAEFILTGGRIDVSRLYRRFGDGATIVMSHLQLKIPELAALCNAVESAFSAAFQTNVYLTPPNAQGFRAHFDSHDVFILQIAGTKRWTLYDTRVELPLPGQHFQIGVDLPGAVSDEFLLEPGDLFYCPRGLMHDARSNDTASLHITFGLMAKSWSELVLEAVAAVSLEEVALRRNLPVDYARPGADRAAARAEFQRLLALVAEKAAVEAVFDRFAEDFITTRRAPLTGQMQQILSVAALTADSVMAPRPNLVFRIDEDAEAERILLICQGTEINLPGFALPALHFALTEARYRVSDIPVLDAAGQQALAARLVREGLILRL